MPEPCSEADPFRPTEDDALAPGIYPLLTAPVPIPTVQLSVHLHADLGAEPVEGFVLVVQRNVSTRAGVSIDETDVWDASGKLLVQARQLRRILGRLPIGVDPRAADRSR